MLREAQNLATLLSQVLLVLLFLAMLITTVFPPI